MAEGRDAELVDVLDQLANLLCALDQPDRADWLAERRNAIANGTRPRAKVVSELRAVVNGLGSLNDLYIADPATSHKRDLLTDRLFALTER
jgi:hypothetical protein